MKHRHRPRGRMIDIGPYYQGDADARLQGIGEVPWPLSLASGTTWPVLPGWPAGLPGLPGLTLPPPGSGLGVPGMPPLGIPTQFLGPYLQAAVLLTPWAWMPTDTTWQEIKNPEFNVALLDASALETVSGLTGPPGWVAAVFDRPVAGPQALFVGTRYDLFSAEAAYSQADIAAAPKLLFVYWGQLSPDWQSRPASATAKILAAGGKAMAGVQLEYAATATRGKPSVEFAEAYRQQIQASMPVPRTIPVPGSGDQPPPPPGAGPPPVAGSSSKPWLALGATVLAAFGLGWIVTRGRKQS